MTPPEPSDLEIQVLRHRLDFLDELGARHEQELAELRERVGAVEGLVDAVARRVATDQDYAADERREMDDYIETVDHRLEALERLELSGRLESLERQTTAIPVELGERLGELRALAEDWLMDQRGRVAELRELVEHWCERAEVLERQVRRLEQIADDYGHLTELERVDNEEVSRRLRGDHGGA